MKKLLTICLAVMIAFSIVAWWMKPGDIEGGRTRLVWGTDENPVRREQIELFHAQHPEILLTADPGNFLLEKIIVQSMAGIGPDVFDMAGVYVLDRLVEAGVAMDLTELAERNGFDAGKTWPGAAECLKIDGRQYAFPAGVYSNVLFYNKALFDKYHLPYPPREMTWQQFAELGQKLTRRRPDGGYDCFGAMNVYWYELVLQAGGSIYSPDRTRCVLDSPEAVEAIQFYHDLAVRYHVTPTPEEESAMSGQGGWGFDAIRWFGEERAAMIWVSRWGLISFRQYDNLKNNLGVSHLPHNRRKVGLAGVKLVGINRRSRKIDEAVQFMRFLTSDEYNRQIVRSADYLPPLPQYAKTDEFLHDPNRPEEDFNDIFVEAVERAVAPEVSPLVSPLTALELISEQLDLMKAGLKTPPQACRDMARAVSQVIYRNLCKFQEYRRRYQTLTGTPFDPNDPQWQSPAE